MANLAQDSRLDGIGKRSLDNIIRLPTPARETLGVNASQVKRWPVAIFAADAEGQVLFVNSQWAKLTGLTLSAASQGGWLTSIHADDRQEVSRLWREAVEGEQPFACSYRLKSTLDKAQWVLSQAVPQYDEDGELTGYSGTLVGMTPI